MNVLKTIADAIQKTIKYAPYVQQAVTEVEGAVGSSNGATKKQIAVAIVLALAHTGEAVPMGAVQLVSGLVDATVTTLNQLGIFSHTSPTVTAPAAA